MVLAEMLQFFRSFGPGGELVFLFVILCVDAMLVPTLPELFVLVLMLEFPGNIGWGVMLLVVVVAAELTGNFILFSVFKRVRLPKIFEKTMKKWVGFLALHDERIILVNRVAPILPFVGAFIAMMKWNPRRSFFYIFVGGTAKYAVLLAFVIAFNQIFEANTARNVTISMILAIIIVSFVQGYFARKKHLGPVAARLASISEKSAFIAPAGTANDQEHGAHGTGGKE